MYARRVQHPNGTFTDIGPTLDVRWYRVRARLLQDLAFASHAANWHVTQVTAPLTGPTGGTSPAACADQWRKAGVSDAAPHQMQYPTFQVEDWPIGSGSVEHSNKRVEECPHAAGGMVGRARTPKRNMAPARAWAVPVRPRRPAPEASRRPMAAHLPYHRRPLGLGCPACKNGTATLAQRVMTAR